VVGLVVWLHILLGPCWCVCGVCVWCGVSVRLCVCVVHCSEWTGKKKQCCICCWIIIQGGPRKSSPPSVLYVSLATVLIFVFTLCYGPGLHEKVGTHHLTWKRKEGSIRKSRNNHCLNSSWITRIRGMSTPPIYSCNRRWYASILYISNKLLQFQQQLKSSHDLQLYMEPE
jgi:hypothetical protein